MATAKLLSPDGRNGLRKRYRTCLLEDVIPFWQRFGLDSEHGGIITSLDRDGSVLDTDKAVWAQGRTAWMFATLYNTVEPRPEWLAAAQSCLKFLTDHAYREDGKLWFTLTREGQPLRMRRYVYSESFAAIAHAAMARATGNEAHHAAALRDFASYLRYSFEPSVMAPKFEATRPMKGIGPHMIAIVTAQELRANLGDVMVGGKTCSDWIESSVNEIESHFFKPDLEVLMESVGPSGEIVDHFDGRTLNPGHAIECAWFILFEARYRKNEAWKRLGCSILDFMWRRGWDREHGGLLYFVDLYGKPVQEYWHDMKFWWPQNEAEIATLLAWKMTGEERYAEMHRQVHEWSFQHFPDTEFGEWVGYLHRDGRVSVPLKGNTWKGCFHLPRMLWMNWQMLESGSELTPSMPS